MARWFVSFADARLSRSLARIRAQAQAMGCFDHIAVHDQAALDPGFRARFAHELVPSRRGFGYWVWKPQILLQTLAAMADGDVLLYLDAGCHLRPAGRARMDEYFAQVAADPQGIVLFQNKPWRGGPAEASWHLPDAHWTKGDLLDHLGVRDRPDILGTGTIAGGIILLRKGPEAIAFVRAWQSVYEHDLRLIDDSPSRSPDPPGFIEHRHDQSVCSILAKLRGVTTLSAFEHWYPSLARPGRPDWGPLHDRPIWAMRDKDIGWWLRLVTLPGRALRRARRMLGAAPWR